MILSLSALRSHRKSACVFINLAVCSSVKGIIYLSLNPPVYHVFIQHPSTHPSIYLPTYLYHVYLSIHPPILSLCLPTYLPIFLHHIYMSIHPSFVYVSIYLLTYLPLLYLSIYKYIFLYIYVDPSIHPLSLSLSVSLSTCFSLSYLSVHPTHHLSVNLSIYHLSAVGWDIIFQEHGNRLEGVKRPREVQVGVTTRSEV